jgi:hypothetical protein
VADDFPLSDPDAFVDEEAVDDGLFSDAEDEYEALSDSFDGEEDAELVVEPPPAPLGRTVVLDFNTGEVVMNGRSPMEVRGESNLRVWIEKCLRTHEGAHPIHPEGYGMEVPLNSYLGVTASQIEVGEVEDAVRAALIYHPAIDDIENFEMVIDDDAADAYAEITFNVIRDDGTREDFDMTLETGEAVL